MEKNIEDRLNGIKKRFAREDFLNNKGLGNEIPFYIFDYPPDKELIVRDFVENDLTKKFEGSSTVQLLVIDLFELMLERLKSENLFDNSFDMEARKGTERFYISIAKSVNLDVVIEEIKKRSEDKNIVCIIGTGKVFPIIRTHELLENLQNIFDFKKVVLFLPGEYTKQKLVVFNEFSENYYRAMRLTGEF